MSSLEVPRDGALAASGPPTAPRRSRARWLVLGGGVLGIFIVLAVLGGFSAEPGGPASSSYAPGRTGVAAWATLLGRRGRPVSQLRDSLGHAAIPAQDTVLLLEPDALLYSEGTRLIEFVRAGGRLVYASSEPRRTLPALLDKGPAWSPGGTNRYSGQAGAGAMPAGVLEARTAGEGMWTSFSGYDAPLRSTNGAALLLRRHIGKGTLELLADVSLLQNRLLATADNAQLALNLAGPPGTPVAFVESVHGYGAARGLAALPLGWRLAFAGLGLAGLLWIAARARRLGPPEPSLEVLPPARSAYADAVALLLSRANDQHGISAALERWREK